MSDSKPPKKLEFVISFTEVFGGGYYNCRVISHNSGLHFIKNRFNLKKVLEVFGENKKAKLTIEEVK